MLNSLSFAYQKYLGKIRPKLINLPWLSMILFGGILFRLFGVLSGPFWYGEVFSTAITRFDLFTMIQKLQVNISPPLWEIVLWFSPFTNNSAIINRFFPCLFSILTLLIVYQITLLLHFSYLQKLFCLGMIAFLPYQAWVARDVRVYALYTLLYTLSIFWVIKKNWLGLSSSIGLLLWCHNTAILYAFSLGVICLRIYPKEWKKIGLCFGFSLASLIPWFPTLLNQSDVWVHFFDPITFSLILDTFLNVLFAWSLPVWSQLFAIAALTFSVVIPSFVNIVLWILHDMRTQFTYKEKLFYQFFKKFKIFISQQPTSSMIEAQHFSVLLIFIPFSLFLFAGFLGKNAIIYRTFTPMVIPLFLWFSQSVLPEKINWYHKTIIFFWTVSLLISLFSWKSNAQGGNLIDILTYIENNIQSGDVIYHATGTTAVLFKYYLPEYKHFVIDEQRVFAEDAHLIFPEMIQASLEELTYQRAWIIWSKEQLISDMNQTMTDRMMKYTRECISVGSVNYPHLYPTEIFLCKNHD